MARKPSTKSKAKSAEPPPDLPADEGHVESPLGAREHLFRVARVLAKQHGFEDVRDPELYALVEEQFIPASQRIINRYNRNADSMLCAKLENDSEFKEAVAVAKGEVF